MLAAVVIAALITSLHSGPEFVTHECTRQPAPSFSISPSLCQLIADRRLQFIGDAFKPRPQRSPAAVIVALLLLSGGVEMNPGPSSCSSSVTAPLRLGLLNARSAVNKAALIHDIISDQRLDLLAVTETWMKASHPAAITHGIAPAGHRVLHRHRDDDGGGGGVALVHSDQLHVTAVPVASRVTGVDHLVSKLSTRHGRLNVAVIYRPPTSSSNHGVPITQFCREFSDLLDELLALPGQLVICGDFNCPGDGNTTVDGRLLDVLESRGLAQRVDQPTHQDGNTLDLLVDIDGSSVTSNVHVVDHGLSDHFLVVSDIKMGRPKPELRRFSFRDFRSVDPADFAANLHLTDVYINPADDADTFYNQIQSSVTAVLDRLAPIKTRTKRQGKRSSRWLSAEAVAAKQTRRKLERRWKRTEAETDRVAYRAACRAANREINASRSAYYTQQLTDVAGDHRATWRLAKELLHSDDRTSTTSPQDASKLCSNFSQFFTDKLTRIANTISSRLSTVPAYHRHAVQRHDPCRLDKLSQVTVEEVTRLIRSLPAKSSPVDFMPTTMLKSTVDVMAPLITRLANLSFSTGVFPSSLKQGRVTPLLKKPGLADSDMGNYRPITNLSTFSKIIEKLALHRLRPHVMSTGNFSEFQSAYRTGHSTETALLKVTNDIITSACNRLATVLLSLDISAAFDTIDHSILLSRTSHDFGISGTALSWLQSFVTDRKQYVAVGAKQSVPVNCTSGVPQGSVLGPLLFAMYISPVGNVIAAHSLRYHQYADDTQLYMAIRPSTDASFQPVSACVEDVSRWFLENGLLLNPAKTEAVLFGTRAQREKIPTADGIDVAGTIVPFCDAVRLLGVTLDSAMTMERHVTKVVRSCSYHTRALRHIRPLLTLDAAKTIGHSIVSSRLDYCNALLYGTSASNLDRLQVVQNTLARAVCQVPRSASATELRRQLHWLPIRQRITYKLAVITHKVHSTGTPAYLSPHLNSYIPSRTLRSSDKLLLTVPRTSLALSAKAFCVSAPSVWNSLSYSCRSAELFSTFRRLLKTELFDIAYTERKHSD